MPHRKEGSNQKYLAFPPHAVKSRSLARPLPGTEWEEMYHFSRGDIQKRAVVIFCIKPLTNSIPTAKGKVALREVKKNCCLPLCLPRGSPPCKQRLETPQPLKRLRRFFLYLSECNSLYHFELPHKKKKKKRTSSYQIKSAVCSEKLALSVILLLLSQTKGRLIMVVPAISAGRYFH